MSEEQPVLDTADPVRDRAWWLRSAVYLLALVAQDGDGLPGALPDVAWWLVIVLVCAPAVFWRDRHPWILAVVALLATATVAQAPIALGVVAVASRARTPWALAYAAAGLGALALPWPRLFTVGVTTSGTDPTGGLALPLLLVVLLIVVPFLIGSLRRTNRLATHARLAFEAEQRDLVAQQATSDERTRIAQEMHDVLGHKLSLLTMQAGALTLNASAGASVVAEQADLLRTTSRQALDDLRGILGVLGETGDPLQPTPGLQATRELVAHAQASGQRIEVSDALGDTTLPVGVGAALHRVMSEALTNAQRHAPGASVRVEWRHTDAALVITVTNGRTRGVGGRPPPGEKDGETHLGVGAGRGLPGLRARVQSLGGRFEAGPTDDGGWALTAELPWDGGNHA